MPRGVDQPAGFSVWFRTEEVDRMSAPAVFSCSICGEPSEHICAYCTKDSCHNHLCGRCHRCSDCCECDLPLGDSEEQDQSPAA